MVRVLLSAFACEPGLGSEPEIGIRTLMAAASRHDVWVLTQPEMAERTRAWLDTQQLQHSVEVIGIGSDHPDDRHAGLKGLAHAHLLHHGWQQEAARVAARLDSEVDFDLVHHATLASYWLPAGVASVAKPLVWGPVGGGTEIPARMVSQLGVRGVAEEAIRTTIRRVASRTRSVRQAPGNAALILAQNPETARRLIGHPAVQILSNALATTLPSPSPESARTSEILSVGRLLPWKGQILAVRAMKWVSHPDAVLHVIGDGGDRARLERAAQRLGVSSRVRFSSGVSQSELFARLSCAGALLQPTLHDEGGGIIAEALALGTPLVCLDHGGPGVIARQWAPEQSALISAGDWPERTARNLAKAVDRFLAAPLPQPKTTIQPRTSYAQAVLDAYEQVAGG